MAFVGHDPPKSLKRACVLSDPVRLVGRSLYLPPLGGRAVFIPKETTNASCFSSWVAARCWLSALVRLKNESEAKPRSAYSRSEAERASEIKKD
jgi:hypothetical protein